MQAWKIDSKTKNKHDRALKTPDDSPELVDSVIYTDWKTSFEGWNDTHGRYFWK